MALNTKETAGCFRFVPLAGAGSGVALNLRLRMYSSSAMFAIVFPVHGRTQKIKFR